MYFLGDFTLEVLDDFDADKVVVSNFISNAGDDHPGCSAEPAFEFNFETISFGSQDCAPLKTRTKTREEKGLGKD
jgi:hypothetical protein